MKTSPEDQRTFERRHSAVTVKLAGEPYDVVDMGLGGFGIRAHQQLEAGSEVPFHIEFPGGGTASGLAEVRWCSPYGWQLAAGLKIVRMNGWTRHRLNHYLYPSKYLWLHFLELAMQFAFVLLGLVFLKDAVFAFPERVDALAQLLPLGFVAAGVGLGFYSIFRRF